MLALVVPLLLAIPPPTLCSPDFGCPDQYDTYGPRIGVYGSTVTINYIGTEAIATASSGNLVVGGARVTRLIDRTCFEAGDYRLCAIDGTGRIRYYDKGVSLAVGFVDLSSTTSVNAFLAYVKAKYPSGKPGWMRDIHDGFKAGASKECNKATAKAGGAALAIFLAPPGTQAAAGAVLIGNLLMAAKEQWEKCQTF